MLMMYQRDAGDSLNDCRILFVSEIYKIEEAGSSEGSTAASDSPLKSKLLVLHDFALLNKSLKGAFKWLYSVCTVL